MLNDFCKPLLVFTCSISSTVPVVFEAQGEKEEAKRQQDPTGEERPHHSSEHRGERAPLELCCHLHTYMQIQTLQRLPSYFRCSSCVYVCVIVLSNKNK